MLPLHGRVNPRMYEVLTADTHGCVASSLSVQRRNLRIGRLRRPSASPFASAARGQQGGTVSSPRGVRSPVLCFRDGFEKRPADIRAPVGPYVKLKASASA